MTVALSMSLLRPAAELARPGLVLSPTHLTPTAVTTAFAAEGFRLRRISASPHLPGEVDLYWVSYKTFSLTIFVESNAAHATQVFSTLSYSRNHDGWPTQRLRNIVVAIQPAGAKPGQAGPLRPMPQAVARALMALSRR